MAVKEMVQRQYERFLAPSVHGLFYRDLIKKTDDFVSTRWMGQTMMQNPLDAWVLQETLAELKPELLIECGTHKGGSSLFYAHLFDILGHGEVITIDVEKMHDLSHPRVSYLLGSSTDPDIVEQVRQSAAACTGPVMVILDSAHSEAHVLRELECYSPMVTVGSWCVVQDAVIDTMWMFRDWRPGPLGAIKRFMAATREFELDEEHEHRYLVTNSVKGWLKRVRPAAALS